MAETFTLVTDGACSGNGTEAARGGWAAIVTAPDGAETVLTGGEFPTTNNRMELTAALEGLRSLPDGSEVALVTDSSYIANAIAKGWLDGWSRKGWRTAGKQPVANRDLWERMIAELARLRVRPQLVRGHAGHDANERADRLAQEAARDAEPAAPPPTPARDRGPAATGRGPAGAGRLTHAARRTLVVGPGAVGGFVAARLTAAGWPVAVLARGATLEALRAGPLRLTDDGVERPVALRAVADPGEWAPVDLALVCTKSFDTGAAGAALAPALTPGAVVLSLQNGVDNPGALASACPGAAVGGVAVYLGCQRLAPDRVVRRPSRDPATGRLRDLLAGGGAGAPGESLAAVAAAVGVPARVNRSDAGALWTKLVANASLNTVTALGRARVGAVFADPRAVALMLALGREVVAVARADGNDVAHDAAEAYVADARRRLPADGGSSTLFDLEAGRRLERDALLGAVVRRAERLGVSVPVSRACDALLRLLDPR